MKKGFTLIEVLVVLAVLAILIGISLPMIKGMQDQANIEKAKAELKTLQLALESYYMHASPKAYPPSDAPLCATYLISATPQMIDSVLHDPFGATADSEYGYLLSNNGKYYAVCFLGPDKTSTTSSVGDTGRVISGGDDFCMSNGIIQIGADNGASCTQDLECQSNACNRRSQVCDEGRFFGDPCTTGSDCNGGYCTYGFCTDGSNGSPCNLGSDCISGYCSTTSQCSDRSIGSPCQPPEDCLSGYCDRSRNACSTGENGQGCAWGSNCQSGICVNHTCTNVKGEAGDGCGGEGTNCQSGSCMQAWPYECN